MSELLPLWVSRQKNVNACPMSEPEATLEYWMCSVKVILHNYGSPEIPKILFILYKVLGYK